MAFKYINPGYAELLSVKDGATVMGEQYSKTGVSFWQPTYRKGLNLSEVLSELYARFDVYIKNPESVTDAMLLVSIGYFNGVQLRRQGSRWQLQGKIDGSSKLDTTNTAEIIRADSINTFWFHIKQGKNSDGILHIRVNGYEVYHNTNAYLWYANDSDSKTITIHSQNDAILISNLILSDEEISPREQVIMLPVQATQTNMTDCGDGSYEATAANQELLQTVDVAALSAQYGADSRVTGISLLGNPAYRTAEGLCALTAIEKSGGNITEYGRHIAEQNPTSVVMDTRTVSMSIEELTGRQFGWRAGT